MHVLAKEGLLFGGLLTLRPFDKLMAQGERVRPIMVSPSTHTVRPEGLEG